MEGNNNKITKGQNSFIMIASVIGVGILSLPSSLAEKYGTDGWVVILIGGIIVSFLVYIMTKLSLMYPGKIISEYGRKIATTPISDIISVIFVVYVLTSIAYILRVFAEVMKMFLLINTPTEIIIISMLLTSAYLTRKGIEAIGRVMTIIIPLVIIPIILLVLPILTEVKLDNLLPVLTTNPIEYFKGIPAIILSFLGFEVIFINLAYIEERKNVMKYNILAVWFITITYIITYLITLVRFGKDELTHLIWPTLSLMKTVQFPGAFLENVEGLVMGLWILMIFGSIVPVYFSASLILSKVSRGKEFRHFVLPLIPIIYILSLVPENLVAAYDITDVIEKYLGVFVVAVVPIVFYILALIRKRYKKGAKDNV